MILENLHTHTLFCDGEDSAEDMVKYAIKKGIKVLGFSGHIYAEPCKEYCMTREKTKAYLSCIKELKEKYKGEIKLYAGCEADLFSKEDLSQFDYVIGSVHFIKANGEFIEIDSSPSDFSENVKKHFNGDFYSASEIYYRSVAECVEKTNADIIGHFDLITKFNEENALFDVAHPRYVNAYKKCLDYLLKFNIPFEINTGAMARGYRTFPYPHIDILRYIFENGGRVVITGDSHSKENLTFGYDKAEILAREAGFNEICLAKDIIKKEGF